LRRTRRCDRHPGSAAPGSARRRTILSKTAAGPGKTTISDHYRQTKKLLGCLANEFMRRSPQHGTLRQQSRRSLASADSPKGTANAPLQISWPSPAVSFPPRCRPESFPSRTSFAEIDESPTLAIAILRGLADSDSSLRPPQRNRPLRTKATPSRPT
jgi:hypothetical protein